MSVSKENVSIANQSRAKVMGVVLTLACLVSMVLLAVYHMYFDRHSTTLALSLWGVMLGLIVLFYAGGFYFVDVKVDNVSVDIKYYSLFPIGREYKRILLPLTKIKRIKVTNGIGALGAKLVVYAKANGFETKYPSVALSACSLSQIKAIKSAINQGVSKE